MCFQYFGIKFNILVYIYFGFFTVDVIIFSYIYFSRVIVVALYCKVGFSSSSLYFQGAMDADRAEEVLVLRSSLLGNYPHCT